MLHWQLLDATAHARQINRWPADPRSVDDQAVWRDDHTIVYAMPGDYGADLYSVPADGTGRARRISGAAVSPAYVR